MLKLIGITGVIASGKTTVSNYIKKKNLPLIEADTLARVAVEKGSAGLKKIVLEFGDDILLDSGELNRAKLKQIIFSSDTFREKLNSIIHPEIESIFQKELKKLKDSGEQTVFYDVPLLFETGMEWMFESIILIFVPEKISLERLMKRDNMTQEFAMKIINSQIPAKDKIEGSKYIIDNSNSLDETFKQVDLVIEKILNN